MSRRTLATLCAILAIGFALAGGVYSLTSRVDVFAAGELSAKDVALPEGEQSIVLVGDIMTWERTREYLEKYGADYPFRATMPLLRSADLTVGNLESPIAEKAATGNAAFPYKVPPWTLKGLEQAGFDLVSLANNHLLDCGVDGLHETLNNLAETKIGHFGAGRNLAEASQPKVVRLGELNVAFCGLMASDTHFMEYDDSLEPGELERRQTWMLGAYQATSDRPGTVIATRDSMTRMVRRARQLADLVIVFPHWGIRYHRDPSNLQRELGRAAVEAGADLVVGHHAHFWQPVELYRDKPIVYGLGNFAFGSANRRADEGLLVRAIIRDKRLATVEIFPLYIKNRDAAVAYQPKIMRGASAADLLQRLTDQSDAPIAIENGRGVIRLAK